MTQLWTTFSLNLRWWDKLITSGERGCRNCSSVIRHGTAYVLAFAKIQLHTCPTPSTAPDSSWCSQDQRTDKKANEVRSASPGVVAGATFIFKVGSILIIIYFLHEPHTYIEGKWPYPPQFLPLLPSLADFRSIQWCNSLYISSFWSSSCTTSQWIECQSKLMCV